MNYPENNTKELQKTVSSRTQAASFDAYLFLVIPDTPSYLSSFLSTESSLMGPMVCPPMSCFPVFKLTVIVKARISSSLLHGLVLPRAGSAILLLWGMKSQQPALQIWGVYLFTGRLPAGSPLLGCPASLFPVPKCPVAHRVRVWPLWKMQA